MKFLVFVCLVVVAASVQARPEEHYDPKWDKINVQEILDNDRMLETNMNCVLDISPRCTAEAKELKARIGEALETNCAKCTDKQKEKIRLVIKHLINKKPEYWSKLVAKYDPEHKYTAKYEEELRAAKE